MKEDIYFTTKISRRWEDWPQLSKLPLGVAKENQLIYVQRYVSLDIVEPIDF